MKKLLTIILSAFMLLTLGACGNSGSDSTSAKQTPSETVNTTSVSDNGKTLVIYFSHSGNTRSVAEKIADKTDADLFEIVTVREYSSDYNTVVEEAKQEQNENARPELKEAIENIDEYDTVFLGYPNWWGDMPMAVYTFLDEYDLSGKTILPFCTHGGSGLSDTVNSIKKEESGAEVKDGLAIKDSALDGADDEIDKWLAKIGF
jgi:flavodoxin